MVNNVTKIKLPDNTEVKIKDARLTDENNLVPLETKTYEGTGFIGTADSWNNCTRYFMSVIPSSSTTYWHIKYRIKIWIPADTTAYRSETAIIEYFGYGITMNGYRIWNTLNSTYATYYHTVMWLTAAGLTNGYGHAVGESILYATNYATSSWYRHFTIDIIAYEGCTITLLDTPLKWSEWTGGNITNYARGNTSPSTYNATSAGLQETGDSDSSSVKAYDAKAYKVGSTNIPAYNPIGENEDGCLVPALSVPFLVEGPFYIYTSALTANATGSWVGLYYSNYNTQIRKGSSYVEGVAYKPLYLKGTISGAYFITDTTTPYVTSLPVSQDNFYYYYIGDTTVDTASSKYTYVSFKVGTHPVYYHNGTGIAIWAPDSGGGNAVQYVQQSLTSSEQMQARENLDLYRKSKEPVSAENDYYYEDGYGIYYDGHYYYRRGETDESYNRIPYLAPESPDDLIRFSYYINNVLQVVEITSSHYEQIATDIYKVGDLSYGYSRFCIVVCGTGATYDGLTREPGVYMPGNMEMTADFKILVYNGVSVSQVPLEYIPQLDNVHLPATIESSRVIPQSYLGQMQFRAELGLYSDTRNDSSYDVSPSTVEECNDGENYITLSGTTFVRVTDWNNEPLPAPDDIYYVTHITFYDDNIGDEITEDVNSTNRVDVSTIDENIDGVYKIGNLASGASPYTYVLIAMGWAYDYNNDVSIPAGIYACSTPPSTYPSNYIEYVIYTTGQLNTIERQYLPKSGSLTYSDSDGLDPEVVYSLGQLTSSDSLDLYCNSADGVMQINHYFITFNTGNSVPTITWPYGVTWLDGSAPILQALKHYEISILNEVGICFEMDL